jgi:hypothetical protein
MDPFDKWEDEVKLKDDEGSAELAIYQIENLCERFYTLYHNLLISQNSNFTLLSSLFLYRNPKTLKFLAKN